MLGKLPINVLNHLLKNAPWSNKWFTSPCYSELFCVRSVEKKTNNNCLLPNYFPKFPVKSPWSSSILSIKEVSRPHLSVYLSDLGCKNLQNVELFAEYMTKIIESEIMLDDLTWFLFFNILKYRFTVKSMFCYFH